MDGPDCDRLEARPPSWAELGLVIEGFAGAIVVRELPALPGHPTSGL